MLAGTHRAQNACLDVAPPPPLAFFSHGTLDLPTYLTKKVIREDFTIEAYDILELHCELVAERMRLVAAQKDVPPDMEQAICTLIWASDRAEVGGVPLARAARRCRLFVLWFCSGAY